MRRLSLLLALAGPLLASVLLSPEVRAQGVGRNAPMPTGQATRPPPPALPGLAGRRAVEPIPPETPTASLSPNDALFDAINRGDLAAARDAMGRGADLNARNQLGLTPVDAAVDQGRNEIVFYLLSARGSSGSGPSQAPAEPATPLPATAGRRGRAAGENLNAPSVASLPGADEPPRAAATREAPRGRAPSAAPALPARAVLFANDGGSPRPEIGFLGFDAGRPAGAEPRPAAPLRTQSSGRHRGR
jgi:hypothetical protein